MRRPSLSNLRPSLQLSAITRTPALIQSSSGRVPKGVSRVSSWLSPFCSPPTPPPTTGAEQIGRATAALSARAWPRARRRRFAARSPPTQRLHLWRVDACNREDGRALRCVGRHGCKCKGEEPRRHCRALAQQLCDVERVGDVAVRRAVGGRGRRRRVELQLSCSGGLRGSQVRGARAGALCCLLSVLQLYVSAVG